MAVRRAQLAITYNAVEDISTDVDVDLISFTYTDNEAGTKDDINITLNDSGMKWSYSWFPTKGDSLSAAIILDGQRLQCGTFAIDEITASGPPRVVAIKASSAPRRATKTTSKGSSPQGGAITEKRTRLFEQANLHDIARQICDECGISLQYLPSSKPEFRHSGQMDESGYAFIKRLAESRGFGVKTTPTSLIILEHKSVDSGEYTGNPAQITLNATDLLSWSFTSSAAQTVQKVVVRWYDAANRKTYTHTAEDTEVDNGITLRISEPVDSPEAAKALAQAKLRSSNVKEKTGSISLPGRTDLVAGITIDLHGVGVYDGVYKVEKVTHTLSGGYVCSADLVTVKTKY